MSGKLTFEQVKKARVFAWHEKHYVYAEDTVLRVIAQPESMGGEGAQPRMVVRRSSLRGTEHLLDEGWHHLDDCSCAYCLADREDRRDSHSPCNGTSRQRG